MKYIISILTVLSGILVLANPDIISDAVGSAVTSCLDVVIPSLYAFTALSVYLSESGLYRVALRPITFPLSKLLRLDEELCAVLVLANIGGYPVGAKLLSGLVKSGRMSEKDGGRMLCCCYGSGPSFVIGLVGMRVFGSIAVGAILYAACFLGNVIMAAIVRSRGEIAIKKAVGAPNLTSECFISSVMSAAKVMLTVCAMTVGFSAIAAILRIAGVNSAAEKLFSLLGAGECSGEILPALLEITNIRSLTPVGAQTAPLCAVLLSFGGICVIMQVSAIARNLPKKSFLLTRPLAAAISAVLALPAAVIQPTISTIAAETGDSAAAVQGFSGNAFASLCILAMCVILLAGEGSEKSDKSLK